VISRFRPLSLAAVALPLSLLLPLGAAAQTYRCVGPDGKKYYEQTIPPQCVGQRIDVLNSQGQVIRRIETVRPVSDEKEREAKEAEAAKKREDDRLAREERRRNNALLATYTNEKDIEEARARALVENDKQINQVKQRIAEIKKRQAGLNKEMEFYKEGAAKASDKKKAAAAKPAEAPPKLLEDVHNAEVDLDAQVHLLDAKQKEVDGINAKYDEDKKRYLELTARGKR
jgi:hypothetical protein